MDDSRVTSFNRAINGSLNRSVLRRGGQNVIPVKKWTHINNRFHFLLTGNGNDYYWHQCCRVVATRVVTLGRLSAIGSGTLPLYLWQHIVHCTLKRPTAVYSTITRNFLQKSPRLIQYQLSEATVRRQMSLCRMLTLWLYACICWQMHGTIWWSHRSQEL